MNNVRTVLSRDQWDFLRKQVYAAAYHTCQICGGVGSKHPVECHEVWNYDDKKGIQKLTGMIALCPACHRVKHFGLARLRGKEAETTKHFCRVNGIKPAQARLHIQRAFLEWEKRSQQKWTLDLSILKDYGITIENKQ